MTTIWIDRSGTGRHQRCCCASTSWARKSSNSFAVTTSLGGEAIGPVTLLAMGTLDDVVAGHAEVAVAARVKAHRLAAENPMMDADRSGILGPGFPPASPGCTYCKSRSGSRVVWPRRPTHVPKHPEQGISEGRPARRQARASIRQFVRRRSEGARSSADQQGALGRRPRGSRR